MDLITPGIGLIFWTTLIFLIFMLALTKLAWKPISKMINKRNQGIEDALNMADKAREEMKLLQADNEKIMAEARRERDAMLNQAKELREQMIVKAKEDAFKEVENLKRIATMEIEAQKTAAIKEIRDQVLDLSVVVAEKIIRKELHTTAEQESLVDNMLKDVKFN